MSARPDASVGAHLQRVATKSRKRAFAGLGGWLTRGRIERSVKAISRSIKSGTELDVALAQIRALGARRAVQMRLLATPLDADARAVVEEEIAAMLADLEMLVAAVRDRWSKK